MARPNPDRNTHVAMVMKTYDVDESVAKMMLRFGQNAYDIGRADGQGEAQRFFRLSLGVETADWNEIAEWNNPVPLKTEEDKV